MRFTSMRGYRSSSAAHDKRDYYSVLGVGKTASRKEIKQKYRELAKKYHPDLNKDDKDAAANFQAVSEAYEVLSDDQKRQMYDTYGHAGVDPNYQHAAGGTGGDPFAGFRAAGFGGFPGGGFRVRTNMNGGIDADDLFDFFEQAMGGGFAQRGPGQDVQTAVRISFLEAVNGCKKDVRYDYQVLEPVSGSTNTRRPQMRRVQKSNTVTVDIPPGVDTGVSMRVQGKGADGAPGFPAGDLFIQLEVAEDPFFKRSGSDLHVEIPISLTQVGAYMQQSLQRTSSLYAFAER